MWKIISIFLYKRDSWDRPLLDNLQFDCIGDKRAMWLEREFEEEEIKAAAFALAEEKAPDPDGFPMAFFQYFWEVVKQDVLSVFL